MFNRARFVDFHLHSHYSDGHDSPEKIAEFLFQTGVKMAALTDHDTMQGVNEFIHFATKHEIIALPGIEVTTRCDCKYDAHILGFSVNHSLSCAEEIFKNNNAERVIHTKKAMLELNEKGLLDVTFDELTRHYKYPGYCITLLHAMDYMVFQKGMSFQAARSIAMSAYDATPRDYSMIFSTAEGIAAVRELGGLPFLAHPGELEKQLKGKTLKEKREALEELIAQMKANGLKGIEAFHSKHSHEEELEYAKLAKRMGLAISAGSDCHGRHKINQAVGRHGVNVIDMLELFK